MIIKIDFIFDFSYEKEDSFNKKKSGSLINILLMVFYYKVIFAVDTCSEREE
jgi:hypothetical protein